MTELLCAVSTGLDADVFARPGEAVVATAPRRRRRRSIDLAACADAVIKTLGTSARGIRAEELRHRTGLDKVTFVRAANLLLSERRARKTGSVSRRQGVLGRAKEPEAGEGSG